MGSIRCDFASFEQQSERKITWKILLCQHRAGNIVYRTYTYVCVCMNETACSLYASIDTETRRRRAARGTIRVIHRELKFFPPKEKKKEKKNCRTVLTIFINALLSRDFFPSVILHSLL